MQTKLKYQSKKTGGKFVLERPRRRVHTMHGAGVPAFFHATERAKPSDHEQLGLMVLGRKKSAASIDAMRPSERPSSVFHMNACIDPTAAAFIKLLLLSI